MLWPAILSARLAALCLLLASAAASAADPTPATSSPPAAKVMLLGLFHFDNPGFDAVKYKPIDVMQAAPQAYLATLAESLARFAPTRILLEYRQESDPLINQRYADFLAGKFTLRKNEIYQLGFRVARLMRHERVHGIDAEAPPGEVKLWGHLAQEPQAMKALEDLIATESERQQRAHSSLSLRELLAMSNATEEDRRNKGFYMLLNPVAAKTRLFHGADASANWWHRNMRMYALIQEQAQAGERVLVIAGSGHTAILRDLLRADSARVEEDVLPYL